MLSRALVALALLTLSTLAWGQQFAEIHARAGLEWSADEVVPEIMSVAWTDLNADGRLDLWTSPHGINPLETHTAPIVYVNQGDGTFQRQENQTLFPHGYGDCEDLHQVSFGDYNNDGFPDVFLNAGGLMGRGVPSGRSLLRNDHTHFTPVATELKLSPLTGSGRGAVWFDANGDGRLDLIAINAIVNTTTGKNPSQLFEQTAQGFADRTQATAFRVDVSANFAMYSHLFGDPIPTIVLMGGEQKIGPLLQRGLLAKVFRHTLPKLEDITTRLPQIPYGRDAAIADFTNDLVPDIFVVNNEFAAPSGRSWESVPLEQRARSAQLPTFLEYDSATQRYVDHTRQAGFNEPIFGSTVLAGDFDNDGFVDLWVFQQYGDVLLPAIFYRNNGDRTFVSVAGANGAAYEIRARTAHLYDQQRGIAAAVADYDGDGFLDIYTGVMARASLSSLAAGGLLHNRIQNIAVPPQLFRNRGNKNHWLELDLIGTVSARDAIGASVIVTAGGRQQFREHNTGNHRTGQDMNRLHFGLGTSETIERIEIRWPSGIVQSLGPVQPDRILRIEELASDGHR